MDPSATNVSGEGLPREPRSDRDDFARRLEYLQLSERDAEHLRRLRPRLEDSITEFVDRFYEHLLHFPHTARFFRDAEMVERLKQSQRRHFLSMLSAEWNEAYVRDRRRAGDVHADSAVEPQYFLGAYNQYVQFMMSRLESSGGEADSIGLEEAKSLLKAIFLDIGLSLDAYFSHSTRALRSALDMVWRANTELRQFAQLASHDLKTPLATVANLCDEALDEFAAHMPPAACELIEAAKQRSYRMSAMIDELLAVATAQEFDEVNEEFSTGEALDEVLERLRPTAAKKGIELVVPASWPRAYGNKIRLREAAYNILSNAIKFIDKQSGKIVIAVREEPSHCTFIVTDNGPGIPADELQRIFSPFRRLSRHRDRPGSGLGLYFTKNLMEQQEGRVWVESELGQGTRFFLQLRRHER